MSPVHLTCETYAIRTRRRPFCVVVQRKASFCPVGQRKERFRRCRMMRSPSVGKRHAPLWPFEVPCERRSAR